MVAPPLSPRLRWDQNCGLLGALSLGWFLLSLSVQKQKQNKTKSKTKTKKIVCRQIYS
jgi:hypothetical protein